MSLQLQPLPHSAHLYPERPQEQYAVVKDQQLFYPGLGWKAMCRCIENRQRRGRIDAHISASHLKVAIEAGISFAPFFSGPLQTRDVLRADSLCCS